MPWSSSDTPPTSRRLKRSLADADAVFAWRSDPAWLPAAWPSSPRVRWIQSASAGVDRSAVPRAGRERRRRHQRPRRVRRADRGMGHRRDARVRDRITPLDRRSAARRVDVRPVTPSDSRGRRLVVVGPGPIGRATATRALALGMSVGLVGRRPRRHETFGDVLGVDQLHRGLAEADHVLDALPLTDATRGLFDAAAFAADGSACPVLQRRARRHGRRAGAHRRSSKRHDRRRCPRCLRRPSRCPPRARCGRFRTSSSRRTSAATSRAGKRRVVALFVENARRFAAGEALVNLVDKQAGHGVGEPPPDRGRGLPPGPTRRESPAMTERVIEVEGLRKSYGGVEAVRGIDLHVDRGEVFALLGPNGAGKTTTVEILEGFRGRSDGRGERARSRSCPTRGVAPTAHRHRAAVDRGRPLPHRARDGRACTAGTTRRRAPPTRSSSSWGSRRSGTRGCSSSREASSDDSTWRSRSPATQSCCSSTSPRPDSTPAPGAHAWEIVKSLTGARQDGVPHDPFHGRSAVPRRPCRRDRAR